MYFENMWEVSNNSSQLFWTNLNFCITLTPAEKTQLNASDCWPESEKEEMNQSKGNVITNSNFTQK